MAVVSQWVSIDTARKTGEKINGIWCEPPRIDILAKCWILKKDKFEFRRFPDCHWDKGDSMCNRDGEWSGVPSGWLPVAWMPIPPIPESWP